MAWALWSFLSDYPIITVQIRKGLTLRLDRWRTLLKYPMWGFRVSRKVTTCPCFLNQSVLIERPKTTVCDARVGTKSPALLTRTSCFSFSKLCPALEWPGKGIVISQGSWEQVQNILLDPIRPKASITALLWDGRILFS